MSCEKASRRLRLLLGKAKRLSLSTDDVVRLPAAKKLLSARVASDSIVWTILATIALILGGGLVLVLFYVPCTVKDRI
ncbi:unnamed protein product [Xylocopa violacea]|uniref:Uncharacterized protein n=1 Tax=Xylocopa violacea TaxID=135666 RepID=A0ABP1P7J8_XYLVO